MAIGQTRKTSYKFILIPFVKYTLAGYSGWCMRWKGRSRTKVILFLSFSSDSPPLSLWGHSTDFCVFVFVGFWFFFLVWLYSLRISI